MLSFRSILLLAAVASAQAVEAQQSPLGAPRTVFAGSETERYLRILQIAGEAGELPWSLRSFSQSALRQLGSAPEGDPWNDRPAGVLTHEIAGVPVLPAEALFDFNTAFPQGDNDGAVWRGKGANLAVRGGVAAAYGPVSLTFAPTIFWAENAEYELAPPGLGGASPYGDAYWATGIDRPQRFGEEAYARFDLGQSSLQIEGGGLQAGLSHANQVWGPAEHYPIILGANAPGFAHLFVGTSHPRTTPIGSFHARLNWGVLEQSKYSFESDEPRRFMTGGVVSYSPPGVETLELGLSRFYHLPMPESGEWGDAILHPFQAFLKRDALDLDENENVVEGQENQLASVFARWVFPRSGFEVYGEFAREDHAFRLRDFLVEPDHTSAFMFGFGRVWKRDDGVWWALRGELLNSARPQSMRIRFAGPFYAHHELQQGHTHRGQPLGTPAAIGGGAAGIFLDRYDSSGKWSASVSREVQGEPVTVESAENPAPLDVLYDLSVERLVFSGDYAFSIRGGASYNFDRYLQDDCTNIHFGGSVGFSPPRLVVKP